MSAYLNSISTACPEFERHGQFLESLPFWIKSPELASKIKEIASNSAISSRYSVLKNPLGPLGSGAFFTYDAFPSTAARMAVYQQEAPRLAVKAVAGLEQTRLNEVTHLVVTTCTGFYAPGIDIDLVKAFGLSPEVKRTVIGFMGCYAAMTGVRLARESVLADPSAVVLMVNVELCSLHLQQTSAMDRLVSYCLFADGAAASLISAKPCGMRLDNCYAALSLADADRMAWIVEDQGFAMTLDARVPSKIRAFIRRHPEKIGNCASAGPDDLWAIHPGGRLILDALADVYSLSPGQMAISRGILREFGNMSSATIMFALARMLDAPDSKGKTGHAMAFGPGLTVEGIDFLLVN